MLRVSAVAEKAGVPSVSLVCDGFLGQARSTSWGLGFPDLRLATVPGHPDVQNAQELERNIVSVTVAAVIEALTGAAEAQKTSTEPAPDTAVFEGSYDEVNRYFYENLWSDGLPIVPPTQERIAAFLAFTTRGADEVIGTLLPDSRKATIRNVAINGVMAGCRPEYMPILVALAEAMADPAYGVEHSGNTPGAETQIILDGPLIKALGFNYEQGALRDGFQANTSIGRFWRLYLRNVAGFLLHQNDKGTFGNTWRVVLAENEDALAEMGWPSVCTEMGMAAGASGVCVGRYTGGHVIVSVFGNTADEVLPYLAHCITNHTGWELIFTVGLANGTYRPLLVLSPIIAKVLAKSGLSKTDVQKYLFEHARMPAQLFEKYVSGWTNLSPGKRSLFDLVALGKAPKMFGASRDPNRLVPIVFKPSDLMLAVSGDPGRTNCYFLSSNGMLGFPTFRQVVLPADWSAQLRRAQR